MKVRSLMFSRVLNFNLELKFPFLKSVPKILNFSMPKVKKTLINLKVKATLMKQ